MIGKMYIGLFLSFNTVIKIFQSSFHASSNSLLRAVLIGVAIGKRLEPVGLKGIDHIHVLLSIQLNKVHIQTIWETTMTLPNNIQMQG